MSSKPNWVKNLSQILVLYKLLISHLRKHLKVFSFPQSTLPSLCHLFKCKDFNRKKLLFVPCTRVQQSCEGLCKIIPTHKRSSGSLLQEGIFLSLWRPKSLIFYCARSIERKWCNKTLWIAYLCHKNICTSTYVVNFNLDCFTHIEFIKKSPLEARGGHKTPFLRHCINRVEF